MLRRYFSGTVSITHIYYAAVFDEQCIAYSENKVKQRPQWAHTQWLDLLFLIKFQQRIVGDTCKKKPDQHSVIAQIPETKLTLQKKEEKEAAKEI